MDAEACLTTPYWNWGPFYALLVSSMIDGTFIATEILARHDETYMPKEVTDALKEQGVYRDPNEGS